MNEFVSGLEKISEDARQKFGGLSATQINWKPSKENWSVGQCFEHLIKTNELYFPAIRKVIDGKHRNNFFSKIPLAVDLIGFAMKKSLNPEQTKKIKTFNIFEPSASGVSETVVENFAANQRELIEMFKAVESFDLHKIKIPEPLNVALNLRLDDAFEILLIHERRHFRQAERVLQMEGFPK